MRPLVLPARKVRTLEDPDHLREQGELQRPWVPVHEDRVP